MRKTLTYHLGVILSIVITFSLVVNAISSYMISYAKIKESVGIEAYGCANITTGLFDTNEIEALKKGDTTKLSKIETELSWTINHKDIFKNQMLLDENGTLLAVDESLKKQGFKAGDKFYIDKEAIKHVIQMKHSAYSDVYEFGGSKRITGYAPIFKDHDPSKEVIAISAIDFDASIIQERTLDIVTGIFLLGTIPMIIALAVAIFFIRRKTRNITLLSEEAKKIAAGDLRESIISIKNNDEIGELSDSLIAMKDQLRNVISEVKNSANQLHLSTVDSSNSVVEISQTFGSISKIVSEVAMNASEDTENSRVITEALDELIKLIQRANESVGRSEQNSDITTSSVDDGLVKVKELGTKMMDINTKTLETEEVIHELKHYSREIETIVNTITEIAEQTNLLALNASIEAARAGEHGHGFAVVADEVRKLAEQSNKGAVEVVNLTKKINQATIHAADSMSINKGKVQEGVKLVAETDKMLYEIHKLVENTVLDIKSIAFVAEKEVETSQNVIGIVEKLSNSATTTSEKASQASDEVKVATKSVQNVLEISTETNNLSNKLNDTVNKFKL